MSHGYVAYVLGDDTAKRAGRLTLAPLAHLDPLGTLMFIISSLTGVGFGWAKPVPVNVARLRHPRRDDILVSVAGVTANLLQAAAWAGLLRVALATAADTSFGQAAVVFCLYGVEINLVLMIFNLLPIPPLDGSHVVAQLIGGSAPFAIERMMPLGFVVLMALLWTGAFDRLMEVTFGPLIVHFVPPQVFAFVH